MIWEGDSESDHLGASLDVGQFQGSLDPEVLSGTITKWDPDKVKIGQNKFGYAYLLDGAVANWTGGQPQFPSIAIKGDTNNDRFGWAVSFIGDLNPYPGSGGPPGYDPAGQVLEDFAVGNPRGDELVPASNIWDRRGKVYVFLSTLYAPNFPSTPPVLAASIVPDGPATSSASLVIDGMADQERFGYDICTAGDWNFDGLPDFAVGAPGGNIDDSDPTGTAIPGRVYIISGLKVRDAALAFLAGTGPKIVSVASVELEHIESIGYDRDRFGYSLVDLGQIDLGGIKPNLAIAVGAPGIYFDPAVPIGMGQTAPGRNYEIEGYVEVLTPAFFVPPATQPPALRSRIVLPASSQPPIKSTANPPLQPDGVAFGNSVGRTDTDGDGLSELIIGVPYWNPNGSTTDVDFGRAWVVHPPRPLTVGPSNPIVEYVVTDTSVEIRAHDGTAPDEELGYTVGDTGKRAHNSPLYATYGITAFKGNAVHGLNACPLNTSNHSGVPAPELKDGGGSIAGYLSIYRAGDGSRLFEFLGEDSRDSIGWQFIAPGDVAGDSQDDLLISGPRWGTQDVGGTVFAREWGRVYYFTAQ